MSHSVIRVDYDALETITQQFSECVQGILEMHQIVRSSVEGLQGEWIGCGSDAFFNEMTDDVMPAVVRLHSALGAATDKTMQISLTVQQAEEEAARLFKEGSGPVSSTPSMEDTVSQVGNRGTVSPDVQARWATLSQSEREAVLRSIANDLFEQHDMSPVPIHFDNYPDPANGDLRGYRNSSGIYIDTDNLGDPTILNTIAHEVRHEIQHEMADQVDPGFFDSLAQRIGVQESPTWPQYGITEAQAQAWDENFDEYITFTDDPQGYRSQPVESEARAFGSQFLTGLTLAELERHIPGPVPQPEPAPTPTPSPVTPAPPGSTPVPPPSTPTPPVHTPTPVRPPTPSPTPEPTSTPSGPRRV